MYASIRGTRIYFDIEGAGLVPDGPVMREKPVAFIIHGGPGSDHSGFDRPADRHGNLHVWRDAHDDRRVRNEFCRDGLCF